MGAAVSVIGLTTLSLVTEIPQDQDSVTEAGPSPVTSSEPSPAAVALDVPAESAFNAAREDRQAILPQGDDVPLIALVPSLGDAAAPARAPLTHTDRDPAAQPQVGQGAGSLVTPPDASDSPQMASPQISSTPRITAPSEPSAPAIGEAAPRGVTPGPAISSDPAQPDQAQAAPDQSAPSRAAPTEEEAGLAALAPLPDLQPGQRRPALPVIEPAPPSVTPDPTSPMAPVAVPETAPIIRPGLGRPAASLLDRPSPNEEAEQSDTGAAIGAAPEIPLRRNAVAFDNPGGRPLLAIVLIDRGDSVVGLEALQEFPYPLTFAVDAARPGAADAAARYRDAGFEVMALVDLAPDSTPQDAEVAMEVSLSAVPDAVAVMEGDATGFQDSRQVSEQVAAILGQRGYGLVMLPNGLNTAQRQAARLGVPSATVFRDFDGAGQDAAAIRRFLDQGAFRAGQQAEGLGVEGEGNGVIMMGRLRPDTISALLLWGLQDRAQRVALAPVSAVLDREE
jgi:polysaccharide deacetylase 2 family uncharacterized protein YibQ